MTTFSYVSTVLTQVNITKPCLIGGLSTGGDLWRSGTGMRVQTQEGGLKGVVWVRCRHAGVVMESQGVFKFV